jgi:hypothetical protein
MDDGTYHKDRGIRFCTNSFTLKEVNLLGELLFQKFNLLYSVHKTGYQDQFGLYIKKDSLPVFIKLVLPYMHPTMYYKLGL